MAFGPALARELVELKCSRSEELLGEALGKAGPGDGNSGENAKSALVDILHSDPLWASLVGYVLFRGAKIVQKNDSGFTQGAQSKHSKFIP